MSLSISLVTIQQALSLYGLSIFLILGTIGNLLLICILSQRTHRRNSCSLYLLSTAIVNFILIQCMLPIAIYSANHIDPQTVSIVWCKIRSYLFGVFLMFYRYCKIAACIDRVAMCSSHASTRAFSNFRIARRMIFIITIISFLIPIHVIIHFQIENNQCVPQSGTYAIFFSIYSIIVSGWSPAIVMVISGIISFRNLKKIKNRIIPVNSNTNQRIQAESQPHISKQDQQSMILLICEIIVYILTNLGYSIFTTYSTITANHPKTIEQIYIESFLNYLASPFLVLINNCIPFYLYLIVSSKFRKDLKQLFHCHYH